MSDPGLEVGAQGEAVSRLHDALRQAGYRIPQGEAARRFFGPGTRAAIRRYQQDHALPVNGRADPATLASVPAGANATQGEDTAVTRPAAAEALTSGPAAPVPGSKAPTGPVLGGQPGDPPATGSSSYTVTGTVLSPALPGVGGLAVQLVDKNVGGDQVLASTQTSSDGSYAFDQVVISPAYLAEYHKAQPDLQVQVSAGGSVLATSVVSYSAPATVSLDVVLPTGAAGLPSEYETLTANLAAVYPGSLGALKEDAGQQDITYLANKTGWDARAVALAALADQFSQITAPAAAANAGAQQTMAQPVPTASVRPEFYYALFRAGLPASPDNLFRASPATAQAIWQQAVASAVIPQGLAQEVPAATASFQALSAANSLDRRPPAGLSTLRTMLQITLPKTADQDRFAQLYAQYQGDWPTFWQAVEQALGSKAAKQLQLTGQLYYLTVNNQPLVAALMQAEAKSAPLSAPLDLATRGYYDPAMWAPLIGAAIPPEIPGADAAERASNYSQLLAAQVRLAFPTAVIADQVRRNILPIADTAEIAADVVDFLTAHQGQFEIGLEPIEGYIARTGLTGTPAGVISQIKRLQRVYQLTPDDGSLAVLLRHNLDSAYAITRYDSAGFVRAFSSEARRRGHGDRDPRSSKQIFGSVLSVAVEYLKGRTAPNLGGQAPVQYGFPPPVDVADLPSGRVRDARGAVRLARLLQLLGLRFDPEPCRISGRSPALYRPARADSRAPEPAGRAARAPARSPVPAADLCEHEYRAALYRYRQRDARVLRGQWPLARELSGSRHRRHRHLSRADRQPAVCQRRRLRDSAGRFLPAAAAVQPAAGAAAAAAAEPGHRPPGCDGGASDQRPAGQSGDPARATAGLTS